MKALSVIELAELYKMNRQSIYKRINKGDLSKNSDGKIDLSEAIRVFGEPAHQNKHVTTLQSTTLQKETEVDILKQQIDILKKQLEFAHDREIFQREQLAVKDNQIEAMQRLLEAPKTDMTRFIDQNSKPYEATDPQLESELKYDALTTPLPVKTEHEHVGLKEHIKPTPKKRGFLGRLARAVFDD